MQIVNFKDYRSKEKLNRTFGQGNWCYVGCGNQHYRLAPSPLANPFRRGMQQQGVTLPTYRRWLWQQIQQQNTAVLTTLHSLNDETTLVCWCHPQQCHAQVIAKAACWLQQQAFDDPFLNAEVSSDALDWHQDTYSGIPCF